MASAQAVCLDQVVDTVFIDVTDPGEQACTRPGTLPEQDLFEFHEGVFGIGRLDDQIGQRCCRASPSGGQIGPHGAQEGVPHLVHVEVAAFGQLGGELEGIGAEVRAAVAVDVAERKELPELDRDQTAGALQRVDGNRLVAADQAGEAAAEQQQTAVGAGVPGEQKVGKAVAVDVAGGNQGAVGKRSGAGHDHVGQGDDVARAGEWRLGRLGAEEQVHAPVGLGHKHREVVHAVAVEVAQPLGIVEGGADRRRQADAGVRVAECQELANDDVVDEPAFVLVGVGIARVEVEADPDRLPGELLEVEAGFAPAAAR